MMGESSNSDHPGGRWCVLGVVKCLCRSATDACGNILHRTSREADIAGQRRVGELHL